MARWWCSGLDEWRGGWNGADLALLSNQAALEAVREYRAQGHSDPSQLRIAPRHWELAHQAMLSQRDSVASRG